MSDTSYVPCMFPVSVKGVVMRDGKVLLLRNERDECPLRQSRVKHPRLSG